MTAEVGTGKQPGAPSPTGVNDNVTTAKKPRTANVTRIGPPPLIAVTAADFLLEDIPPRGLVLDPVIPTQGLVLLYAQRGVGKTFVALGIAQAVATGGRFLRWSAPEPRRVLYVDGEMPEVTMQERIRAIAAGAPSDVPGMPDPSYFRLITPDKQPNGIPDLSTSAGQKAIDAVLGDTELLVIDNLSALIRSGNENEAEGWQPIQTWVLGLRRRGVSVLFIHHAGKGGNQRGTSRREDVLDTVIALRHPSDYQSDHGARFEVHYEKTRALFGPDVEPFEAKLEVRDGAAVWTMRAAVNPRIAQIVALYREGKSMRKIAQETRIPNTTVQRLIEEAHTLGLIPAPEIVILRGSAGTAEEQRPADCAA